MTRPMTGQPETEDEMAKNTQKANAELSKMLKNGEIERGFDDNGDEESDEEKLEELRNFREQTRELGNDEIGAYGEPQTAEKEMKVVDDNGDVHTFTKDEWEERRGRTRVWYRLERNGGMYVRVAHWFNDADTNKVKIGDGFYGHKVGETEKALKFEVSPEDGDHNAEVETVWIPKKAARTHEIKAYATENNE